MNEVTLYTNARLLDPESGLDIKGELLTINTEIAALGIKVEAPKLSLIHI